MSNGKTPRFTRRVHKDFPGIKAKFQKNKKVLKNKEKELDRFNRKIDKNREIDDFNLIQYILLLIN